MTEPLRNVSVPDALAAWLEAVRASGGLQPLPAETVAIADALGRITAEPVIARISSPAFDAAAMDGLAVVAATTAGAPVELSAADFQPVDTGDPLPAGTDAVVRREHAVVAGGAATVGGAVTPYANVRQVGEDVCAGELVFAAGRRLGPADLAVAASAGHVTIAVHRRPLVAVIPSGEELVPPGSELASGEIVETNSLMLAAMVTEGGATAVVSPIVPDDPMLLTVALERAAREADLVLLLAGSSKGAGDHTVGVIAGGGQVVVQGVAIRPGHPVVLGLAGNTPVMGVPGYPVSAALAFEQFCPPLLAVLGCETPQQRQVVTATAAVSIASTESSNEWVRMRIGRFESGLVATPLRRGAAILTSIAHADGLLPIPPGSSGVTAGDDVAVELLRPLASIEAALLAAGSTEPLLEQLAMRLDLRCDPNGSANGASALLAGHCHLGLVAEDDLPGGLVALARWRRELGLVVAAGNPLELTGIDSLAKRRARLVNRQPGSSARRFLDQLLAEQAVDPSSIPGYEREARSHAAAAAAVAAGSADCALVTRAVAAGLEFVGLRSDTLVLVALPAAETDERISRLGAWLASSEARLELAASGYEPLQP